jgi:hypothetical protein
LQCMSQNWLTGTLELDEGIHIQGARDRGTEQGRSISRDRRISHRPPRACCQGREIRQRRGVATAAGTYHYWGPVQKVLHYIVQHQLHPVLRQSIESQVGGLSRVRSRYRLVWES